MNAIEVKNVSKNYGRVKALDDVSFFVGKGEVFGLIGPDGAGKTSMFRILCSLLLPETGTASVDGFDVVRQMRQVRCRVGYMPQGPQGGGTLRRHETETGIELCAGTQSECTLPRRADDGR